MQVYGLEKAKISKKPRSIYLAIIPMDQFKLLRRGWNSVFHNKDDNARCHLNKKSLPLRLFSSYKVTNHGVRKQQPRSIIRSVEQVSG
jgi:hypothetical protein